ncbi:Os06g0590200 [Oryza sativa Japonica Group]|uniref:Os06g0590200 protein n=2 Tax=Oryza TaxID=4527 RepID=A0A0P0WYP1_ORYSJ|nr:Os06g0590200 [Oryza sativa Japonica Group]
MAAAAAARVQRANPPPRRSDRAQGKTRCRMNLARRIRPVVGEWAVAAPASHPPRFRTRKKGMTPPTWGRTRPMARREDGAKGSRAASSLRVQMVPPSYPALEARGRTKAASVGLPHRESHRSEVAVLPPWVAPWWPDLETVARWGWRGGAAGMAQVERRLVGSGLLGEEEEEKGNGMAEVNPCVCFPVVRLSLASSPWVRGWRRATAAVYASGYEEIRPRGICV